MKTLGVGILGYGFMGKTHTYAHKTIPFYYDPEPAVCRLKVICETPAQRAQAAQVTGGFERATTDFNEVIGADDVDIVHICTPNHLHFPALAAAIRAHKHIYVDKPVTATLKEAEELERLLPGYKGVAQVALQYRFYPSTLRARKLIQEGFLGAVTHFHAAYQHSGSVDPHKAVNWKSTAAAGGGVIRDLGAHILDLMNWLIGPFVAVNCVSRIWSQERPSLDKPGETITVDAEDAALMLLRGADGAIGSVEVSKLATGAEDQLGFEIHGRHGAMRFDLMRPNYLEIYDGRLAEGELGGGRGWQKLATVQRYPRPGDKFPGPKFSLGWIRGHVHSLYCFLRAITGSAGFQPATEAGKLPALPGNQAAQPSLQEGLYLQRMLEAVRNSAESRQWIDLPRFVAQPPSAGSTGEVACATLSL